MLAWFGIHKLDMTSRATAAAATLSVMEVMVLMMASEPRYHAEFADVYGIDDDNDDVNGAGTDITIHVKHCSLTIYKL